MSTTMAAIDVRTGEEADVPVVLALLDGAVRWLVERGHVGQWGTEPQSTNPRRIVTITQWAGDGSLYLACLDQQPVGALAVGAAPAYVPAVDEPELYVNLLVTDRALAGRGIGRRLLTHAREIARTRGVGLLRMDCYSGDDRTLVRYYEQEGFSATDPFTVELPAGPWPGQVLEQRLDQLCVLAPPHGNTLPCRWSV